MRAVNLIPGEGRGRARAISRGSMVGYAVIGLLAAVLLGVVAVVLTDNSISERKAELAAAEQRQEQLAAQTAELAPYTEFAALAAAREQTIRQLATSRFDWERVLNELALVLPDDVWLTEMTGTVSPEVEVEGSGAVASRASVDAPALELVGCAVSQDAVASLVSALEDIDGVTRVGLDASERADQAAGSSTGDSGGGDCRTRDHIAQFQIVVAFDSATSATAASGDAGVPPTATPAPTEPADSGEPAAEVQSEQQATEASATEASEGANSATNVAAGVRP